MKGLLLFIAGVATGFVVAHEVSKTETGQKVFSKIDEFSNEYISKAKDFTKDAYGSIKEKAEIFGESAKDKISSLYDETKTSFQNFAKGLGASDND